MHELVFKNFWLKVFSLMLATTMWYVLQPNIESENRYLQNPFRPTPQIREFKCAVTLLVPPSERRNFQVEPTTVTLKLSGDATILHELDTEDIEAYVNVATIRDPHGMYPVEAFVPKELIVRSLLPTHVFIKPSE